jgi:hypothetical protein
VVIAINPSNQVIGLNLNLPDGGKVKSAFQTDRQLNCEAVKASSPLPPKSIRTLVYSK